jgi:disulfide oxidoreductase YuzD
MHKFLFYNKFISCVYVFRALCAHHQEVKIALHNLWYHHTYGWPSRARDDKHMCSKHVEAWNKRLVKQKFCASGWLITEINILRCRVSKTSKLTYRCDDARGCVMQFWPPDDEHMCSKHVEAWNKRIVKRKFCESSWLITDIKKMDFVIICSSINSSC